MRDKVINTDFFKKKNVSVASESMSGESVGEEMTEKTLNPETEEKAEKAEKAEATEAKEPSVVRGQEPGEVKISYELKLAIREIREFFEKNEMDVYAKAMERILEETHREKFSVAVVGEFSRGKSTFINKMLGRKLLPVADLPTTAMLTRIRHNDREMILFMDEKGQKKTALPISEKSWQGYVADNFGDNEPVGMSLVGVKSKWLSDGNIEIIDTPGAGDLEAKRAKVIGNALMGCDGAIITISAAAALSRSEKLFIEERLIAKKTPYLMLIVTKLDLVPFEQRADVIDYIKQKLSLWHMDIPVYVPYEVDIPDNAHREITGMDKVINQIDQWLRDSRRSELTEQWLAMRTQSVIDQALSFMKEQKILLEADENKRRDLVREKEQKLMDAETKWEELKLRMMERGNHCYEKALEKIDECTAGITERLQFEAANTNAPYKWWNENYPYRLKVELANMSATLERTVTPVVKEDIRWLNNTLGQYFKSHVLVKDTTIADAAEFKESAVSRKLEMTDVTKERNISRIGTAVLTLTSGVVLGLIGGPVIIASMGIGTGSTLISEKIFRGKIEKQHEAMKEAIARNVPEVVAAASEESEKRVKAIYSDAVEEATKQEELWLNTQKEAIDKSVESKGKERLPSLLAEIEALENIKNKLSV